MMAASEARPLGHGGVSIVSRACGLSRVTIAKAIRELDKPPLEDPDFAAKAGRVLDLYEGIWEGQPLGQSDYAICADEKTSIQARRRRHRTLAPRPAGPLRRARVRAY